MEYENGQSEDDGSYVLEEHETESSDGDFSGASEDDMVAWTVDSWTFVTDSFSDHHVKEFCKQFDFHPALLLSDAKCPVDYFKIFFKKSYPLLVPVH